MSSRSEIYFNYHKAIRQAGELEQVAERLQRLSTGDIQETMNEINSAWKSDSSPAYLQKGAQLQKNVEATSKNLRNVASSIRTIARRILRAELEAWRIAHERD